MSEIIPVNPKAPLTVIGTADATLESYEKSHGSGTGETGSFVYKGAAIECTALYEDLISRNISCKLSVDKGRGVVTAMTTGADVDDDFPNSVDTDYELFANEITRPIEQLPYFVDDDNTTYLTPAMIIDVFTCYDNGLSWAAAVSAIALTSYTDDEKELMRDLFAALAAGITSYNYSQYVVRETRTLSGTTTVRARYTDANTVTTKPDVDGINAILGVLPDGEWLQKTPTVRRHGTSKWQLCTEWWWAKKWYIHAYPGGTWDPNP